MSKHATINRAARGLLSKAEQIRQCRAATGSARRHAVRSITPRRKPGRRTLSRLVREAIRSGMPVSGGTITPAPSVQAVRIDAASESNKINVATVPPSTPALSLPFSPDDVAKAVKSLSPAMRVALAESAGEFVGKSMAKSGTIVALIDRGILRTAEFSKPGNTERYYLTDLGCAVRWSIL